MRLTRDYTAIAGSGPQEAGGCDARAFPSFSAYCVLVPTLWVSLAAAGCASQPARDAVTQDRAYRIDEPVVGNIAQIVPAPAGPGTAVAASHVRKDLSGSWLLDTEASDDPEKRIREAMKSMMQAGGGGRGMSGGSPGRGRGGGMGGGQQGRGPAGGMGSRGQRPQAELAALATTSPSLEITHEDPMLLIVHEGSRTQRLYTDFRGATVSANGGLDQRVTVAGWEGAVLVVETITNGGLRLIQRYQMDIATDRLVIASAIHLPELQPVSFRLVYNRSKRGQEIAVR